MSPASPVITIRNSRACAPIQPVSESHRSGTRRLTEIIRTWRRLKHRDLRFNIIDTKMLLAPREEPEKYRNRIVRIAATRPASSICRPRDRPRIIARTEEQTG